MAFRVSKRAAATSPRARTRPPAGEGDATPTGEGNRVSAWHAPTYLYADVLYKHAPQDSKQPVISQHRGGGCRPIGMLALRKEKKSNCDGTAELLGLTVLR